MIKVAVIGSGGAGLSAAYQLSKRHQVDIFESGDYIGGHANTVQTSEAISIDTGFIVFNETNYPTFVGMLQELGVPYVNSDMSFSCTNPDKNFCFGSDFPKGVFNKPSLWFTPGYYRFLYGIHQFNKTCLLDHDAGRLEDITLGEYLTRNRIPLPVQDHYVIPMTGAIWSVSDRDAKAFPMTAFVRFWKNHDLLRIGGGLQWKTLPGGSQRYIQALLKKISGKVEKNRKVLSVERDGKGIWVISENRRDYYDGVVVATHADQAFRLLAHPTPLESQLLSPWQYSKNKAVLHRDSRVMPAIKSAWCSWNVKKNNSNSAGKVSLTYWMNRLQPLKTQTNYFVTLNPESEISKDTIEMETDYTHPIMNQIALSTQPKLKDLNTQSPLVFCGSYFGYGFHEDAVASGYAAAAALERYFGS